MSSYGSTIGYDDIVSDDEDDGEVPLRLPLGVVREEPAAQEPIKYDPQQPLISRPVQQRRVRSHSTIATLELLNRWTKQLIPKWAVTSSNATESRANEILYSVFKPVSGIEPIKSVPAEGFGSNGPISKIMFERIVDDVVDAIESGSYLPQRISAGSSGSYFVYNSRGETVGVFKPKDEEPYGNLSPKWSKFIHRNLFPCFFGRSCLIPNLGYICESAASLLDRQLQSFIVPFTDTVFLSSPTFYYSVYDRLTARLTGKKFPKKVGSLQLFLDNYQQADDFFKEHPLPGSRSWGIFAAPSLLSTHSDDSRLIWTNETLQQFREELEKLVILDYIMRNTDRGLDNWMIKVQFEKIRDPRAGTIKEKAVLKIGAIDSGLSWPWKHPDEWRSFPFGWLYLPISVIGQPFSEKTREHYLRLLTSTAWWEESSVLFRETFSRDTEFKERMWKKQWAVMKGQAFNVVETLKTPGQGPLELVRRTRMTVWDDEMDVPLVVPEAIMETAMRTPIWENPATSPQKIVSANDGNSSKILPSVRDSLENYQNEWSQLINGDINDSQFEQALTQDSPLLTSAELRNDSILTNSGNLNLLTDSSGYAAAVAKSMATKRVIIERLQTLNSKPPVFTWC